MGRPPRLLCCLFLALSLAAVARAATRHHEWEISYQFRHSDCVRKLAVTINGETPGPTIRAVQGDTVVVRVKNSLLTENVAIHWHGIRQIGTPWADGTEGVTQCPVLPGDVFTYAFVVDRPGTYMYHAHYGMQRSAGLNGLIVVAAAPGGRDAEPFAYDGEHEVLLNDWWHKSTYEQAAGLASAPIFWVGEPQSLLINGRGRFANCSAMAAGACNAAHPECAPQVFAVVPGKAYRFCIASVTSLSALNFEIEGHEDAVSNETGNKNHKGRLIACANESITIQAVSSGTTRSRRPPMAYHNLGAALVVVMLYLAAWPGSFHPLAVQDRMATLVVQIANTRIGVSSQDPKPRLVAYESKAVSSTATPRSRHPIAGQQPTAAEGTITRSAPSPSVSDSPPFGGGHTPPPLPPSTTCSTSTTGPADSNPSGTPSAPPSEGSIGTEEDPSGPPSPPPQRPVPPTIGVRDNEGQLLGFVVALGAYDVAIMLGVFHELVQGIIGGWSTAPKVVYVVWVVLVFALLAVGFIAAGCHATSMAGNSNMLRVSASCMKLGAILSTDLLVVAISSRFGRVGCVAAVPSAAVMTAIISAVWIMGGRMRQRQPAGDDMV